MTEYDPSSRTRMYYAARLPEQRGIGLGKPILPEWQSYEDYRDQGKPVLEEPYDVSVVSILNSPVDRRDPSNNQVENIWVVHYTSGDSPELRIPMGPHTSEEPDTRYIQLATEIETRLGRTGLTIIVS